MSSTENPFSGYVIEAVKLEQTFLNSDHLDQWTELCDNLAFEGLVEFCDENLPLNVPRPSSFFMLDSGNDTSDGDLSYDVIYAMFDEEDLYERRPKAQLVEMQQLIGSGPEHHNWTMFG